MSKLFTKFLEQNYKFHLFFSFTIRLLLILYGSYHDGISEVPYTDIDYKVFTDASRHILSGKSPYLRHTYRYSPLIAIFLIPNVLIHHNFGKLLFCLVDIVVGLLIRTLVESIYNQWEFYQQSKNQKEQIQNGTVKKIKQFYNKKEKRKSKTHKNEILTQFKSESETWADRSMLVWLYNPMALAISSRGNSDSIACFLVLLTLYFLQHKKLYFIAGLIHGLAIHFRLYPIIYSLTYFISLSEHSFFPLEDRQSPLQSDTKAIKNVHNRKKYKNHLVRTNSMRRKNNPISYSKATEKKIVVKKQYFQYLIPNMNQTKLVMGCLISLLTLTCFFYYLYGYQFLYESLIYHFVRTDTRHNFSLYFYLLYLTAWIKNIGYWQTVLMVLPQLILMFIFSVRYGLNRFSLNFAVLLITIVFVIYNKVLTSQYFVWIMGIFPLCLWQIKLSKNMIIILIFIWFLAQAGWLLPAYLLEFQGENSFLCMWIQGVSLFCAHVGILGRLIKNVVIPSHEKNM